MKVKDLFTIGEPYTGVFSRVIAFDTKAFKVLFDTAKDSERRMTRYDDGEVVAIWADLMKERDSYVPVIYCKVDRFDFFPNEIVYFDETNDIQGIIYIMRITANGKREYDTGRYKDFVNKYGECEVNDWHYRNFDVLDLELRKRNEQ